MTELAIACALLAAGCGGGSYVVVTVDSRAPLVVDALHVEVRNALMSARPFDVPAPGGAIDLGRTPLGFSLQFGPERSGAVHVDVQASRLGTTLALAAADGTIVPGSSTAIHLTFGGPPPADMAPDSTLRDSASSMIADMPDSTMPDLAMPDPAMPDLTMPDLAMPDLTMPDLAIPCGHVGQPCCNGGCVDGSQCLSGTQGGRCAVFGGAFQANAGMQCLGACQNGNPYDAQQCLCPPGFFDAALTAWVEDDCPTLDHYPSMADLQFCTIDSIMPAGSDWAGAFAQDDAAGMCAQGCRMPNPFTGACSCPPNTEQLGFRTFVPGNCGAPIGATLAICLVPVPTPVSIAGGFEIDDVACPGDLGATGRCRYHSGALADCQCPANTVAVDLRAREECGAAGRGATITLCAVAVP
jgi:hypothetical protein